MLMREQGRTRAALGEAEAAQDAENFDRAEQNFHDARDVVDQFGVRMADRLTEMPGMEPVRRQLLANTLRYYRAFVEQAANDPSLRHELALAHFKSGVIAAKLGDAAQAATEYKMRKNCSRSWRPLSRRMPRSLGSWRWCYNNLAILAADRGDVDGARKQYDQAIGMQRRLVARACGRSGVRQPAGRKRRQPRHARRRPRPSGGGRATGWRKRSRICGRLPTGLIAMRGIRATWRSPRTT